MRKYILSMLVVVITFLTVVAMITFKTDFTSETSNITYDETLQNGKPDGTGYIFEDFNKGINIPVEECNKSSMNSSKGLNFNYMMRYKALFLSRQAIINRRLANYISGLSFLTFFRF